MTKLRRFRCDFTYNQLMLLNKLIDEYILSMDRNGKDILNDEECIQLKQAKSELLTSYLGQIK